MLAKLLLGAAVALAAPQEPQDRTDERVYEVKVPAIDIKIPEYDIDIEIPMVAISIPAVEFYYDGFDMYLPYVDVEIPAFTIEIPELEYVDWYYDDHDWGYQDLDMDTTMDVSRGARLELRNHAGEIIIRSWSRDQVRVEASYSSDDRIKIFQSGSTVSVKTEARHGHPESVDFEITVPNWMAIDLWGFYTDISVDGVAGGVQVETLEGEVMVRNSGGEILLRSVEGDVIVQRSTGVLEINSMDGEIDVLGYEGRMFLESVDGDITLEGINSASVEAKTVDGDVYFEGVIAAEGRYKLTTHDGDVVVKIPANTNASVSVATFDGEFEADFPVQLQGTQASRKFSFVLGDGGARLELSTFDGDIQLLRR